MRGARPLDTEYTMNVENRTLFIADNLDIMRGIDSDCIDLIYLDPPFNTKKQYKAPIGSPAEGASFKDIWTDEDVKDGWYSEIAADYPHIHQIILAAEHTYDHSMMIYLMAMGIRLIEMQRILKPTGSIYLHCDPTASHYLKTMMDSVFGWRNFRNEIAWGKYAGRKNNARKKFNTQQDTILYYAYPSATFFPQYEPLSESAVKEYRHKDENGRLYRFARRGRGYESAGGNKRIYLDENPGNAVGSLWITKDLQLAQSSKERTGYPTQKPLKLLERIIKASSNEGDVVLDPFCGCATACVAAERLGRQWIGIDISPSAETITKLRLTEEAETKAGRGIGVLREGQMPLPFDPMTDIHILTHPLLRTDVDENEPQQQRLPNYRVHKNDLYGKQEGDCNGCRDHFKIRHLEVDHIVPQSAGGTDHPKNLQLLCSSCNRIKGRGSQEELIQKLKERGYLR